MSKIIILIGLVLISITVIYGAVQPNPVESFQAPTPVPTTQPQPTPVQGEQSLVAQVAILTAKVAAVNTRVDDFAQSLTLSLQILGFVVVLGILVVQPQNSAGSQTSEVLETSEVWNRSTPQD